MLVYVPMDNWIYPAFSRLQALGYADTAFQGLRPWTRTSCLRMLEAMQDNIEAAPKTAANQETLGLFDALSKECSNEITTYVPGRENLAGTLDRVYTWQQYMSGSPVNDSFHFGQTLVNDDGRPYQGGYNQYTGVQAHVQYVRFTLDLRGKLQHAPGRAAYSSTVQQFLDTIDARRPAVSRHGHRSGEVELRRRAQSIDESGSRHFSATIHPTGRFLSRAQNAFGLFRLRYAPQFCYP